MCFMNLKCLFCILIAITVLRLCRGYISDEVDVGDDEYDCEESLQREIKRNPGRIYLFKTFGDEHRQLNRKLLLVADKLEFQVKLLNKDSFRRCYDDITTMRLAAKYGAVINLRAKLILPRDNGYFSKTFKDISLIGESTYEEPQTVKTEVCKGDNTYKSVDGEIYETCKIISTSISTQTVYVKVISNSVDKVLVKFIETMEKNNEQYDTYWNNYIEIYKRIIPFGSRISIQQEYILVCGLHENKAQIRKLSNLIIFTNYCKDVNEFSKLNIELLVVIAKKPLDMGYFTDLPIFFYNTPSLLSLHYATYPNSMVLFDNSFELLVEGFMRLAKLMHWNRIAILSHNSSHSKEFQRPLVDALTKSNVLYAVKSSLAVKCEFEQNLEYLKQNEAKIIIANIEETCVPQVMDIATKLGMTAAAAKIIWIFRELSVNSRSNLTDLENTYIMKLEPVRQKSKETGLDNIALAVAAVTETLGEFPKQVDKFKHNSVEEVGKNHSQQSRRELAKMYRQVRQRVYSVEFQLQKILHSDSRAKNKTAPFVIYAYNFKDRKASVHHDNSLYDSTASCFFLSHKFETPCNDALLFVISLVLLALLLTWIILVEFFRNFTRNGFNYRYLS